MALPGQHVGGGVEVVFESELTQFSLWVLDLWFWAVWIFGVTAFGLGNQAKKGPGSSEALEPQKSPKHSPKLTRFNSLE